MHPAPARPVVIKIGGRSLEAPGAPSELAAEVASLSGAVLLVHGGGREVTTWCERFSLAPRFVDGLRVTDPATLEVAVAVLAGLANKRLVASLRAVGVDAVGLAALDGGIVEAVPHPDAAVLGKVGAVQACDGTWLASLLAQGRVPVISSIAEHRGELLNLNADDLAAALAGALGATALILLSDSPGVVIGGSVVPEIRHGAALEATLGHPEVSGGMIAKLRSVQQALAAGVRRVRIASWSGAGTLGSLLGTGPGGTLLRGPHDRNGEPDGD